MEHPDALSAAVLDDLAEPGGGDAGDDVIHRAWDFADAGVAAQPHDLVRLRVHGVYGTREPDLTQGADELIAVACGCGTYYRY